MSEERLERIEERLLETETKLDEVITGQNMIYSALEAAGLMKNGEPKQPARWDPAKIKWTRAEGAKGMYERYPAQGEKAEPTDDYKNMLAAVKRNDGKMMRGGYFMWAFQDGSTIGRKRTKKSKAEPKQSPASSSIQTVRAKFPQDLEKLLNFSFGVADDIIIKPRQFLGSENFARIAAVVRNAGGEYVSAGKDSHFRVPAK